MEKHNWKKDAECFGMETNDFFDNYEEDVTLRPMIDAICRSCPVMKQCFAVGVTSKAIGVWGGVYFDNGKISREFNRHKSKQDWAEIWKDLTMDKE